MPEKITGFLQNILFEAGRFKYFEHLVCFLTVLVMVFIILYLRQKKKNAVLSSYMDMNLNLMNIIHNSKGLEDSLNHLLRFIPSIINTQNYSFYVLDEANKQYVLKTIRYVNTGSAHIHPSYSGLIPYSKETYSPPASIPLKTVPEKTSLIKEGAVPLVAMPVNKNGLICIGPATGITKKTLNKLDHILYKLSPVFDILLRTENLKKQVNVILTSTKAIREVSNIIFDHKNILGNYMNLLIKTVSAQGGLFLKKENNKFEFPFIAGMDKNTHNIFINDRDTHLLFEKLLGNNNIAIIKKGEDSFYKLPVYFPSMGVEMILCANVPNKHGKGIVVFWYNNTKNIEGYKSTALIAFLKRLGEILNNTLSFKKLSSSYIEILKNLVQMVDNLTPHTIGRSELMYRYSKAIAHELGLSRNEVQEIGTAAYLSNIGVIGLSDNLLYKKGRYSDVEYEMMKLHSEIGASIIEMTIGNNTVATYIRQHHERIDGMGYPAGISGDQITTGAKIIAVSQTFLAKISGRADRKPLPFNKAISLLKASAGTQLDSEVVNALIRWFKKKQNNPSRIGRSLGPCWEMKCIPESICSRCPAYKRPDVNCWEVEGVLCSDHGDECSSCYVYTEYLSRNKVSSGKSY